MIPPVMIAAMAAATPAPLLLETRILAETPVAAADGTTRMVLAPPRRIAPGDPLVVELGWRNTGTTPIAGLVLANPLPPGLAYRGAQAASPAPEVSVDGIRFGPLATLAVALPGGGTRPATMDDIVHVRWRLPGTVAGGAAGRLAFRAIVR